MMFRKEIAVALKSCLTDIQAAGELYFQPAKRGGIYLTVMLHGMDAVHTQTVLCMETEHKTVKFPLPVPCQGLIELCPMVLFTLGRGQSGGVFPIQHNWKKTNEQQSINFIRGLR